MAHDQSLEGHLVASQEQANQELIGVSEPAFSDRASSGRYLHSLSSQQMAARTFAKSSGDPLDPVIVCRVLADLLQQALLARRLELELTSLAIRN